MKQTDSMLDTTGSRRMRPAQTWWVGRSWRADRVVRNRERNLPHRYEKGCNVENAISDACHAWRSRMTTPRNQYFGRSGLCQYVGTLL